MRGGGAMNGHPSLLFLTPRESPPCPSSMRPRLLSFGAGGGSLAAAPPGPASRSPALIAGPYRVPHRVLYRVRTGHRDIRAPQHRIGAGSAERPRVARPLRSARGHASRQMDQQDQGTQITVQKPRSVRTCPRITGISHTMAYRRSLTSKLDRIAEQSVDGTWSPMATTKPL